ncbi:MAG: lysyl oxidase family protein [Chloroflexota bacterium]|nr:lysyl oxidase family protein [Chloroflexota bacterium]
MLRLRRRAPMLGISLAMMAVLLPAGVMAGGPTDLLPDLRMAKPTGIRLDFSTIQNKRLLRFDAIIVNVGRGPLLVKGKRDCATSDCPEMRTLQRIKQSNGTWRGVATDRPGRFDVGDGHNHWHVLKVQHYELFQLGPRAAGFGEALAGAKTGFCFFDTSARRLSLPRAPQRRVFSEAGCGRSTSTSFRMGLSVGWGDLYGAQLPRQWIDTTGIDDGRYLLCSTANGEGDWLETDTTNNQAWAEIRLVDGDTVEVLRTGRSACASQLPAVAGILDRA